jgi:hypothetical protein
MTEILFVPVVTVMPSKKSPLGRVEEGFYRVEDGTVFLVTATGSPRFNSKGAPIKDIIRPGETAREVAHRLTKKNMPPRQSDFNRPLYYPNRGKI